MSFALQREMGRQNLEDFPSLLGRPVASEDERHAVISARTTRWWCGC